MTEQWKYVEGYDNDYMVSSCGNVKSMKRASELILSPSLDGSGYLKVSLYKDSKERTLHIHKLVAIAFLNHTSNGHVIVIDHIDHDPLNNKLENLQLITQRENASRGRRGCTSDYTGVTWHKVNKKWLSKIRINGKCKHLGVFECEVKASEAYQSVLRSIEN